MSRLYYRTADKLMKRKLCNLNNFPCTISFDPFELFISYLIDNLSASSNIAKIIIIFTPKYNFL